MLSPLPSLRPGHILMASVAALIGLGVIMVHSAGLKPGAGLPAVPWQITPDQAPEPESMGGILPDRGLFAMFLTKTTAFGILALLAMAVASRINVRGLMAVRGPRNPLIWGTAACMALCLAVYVPGFGVAVLGARRWLNFGVCTIQPSELLKWILIPTLAWWCARRGGVMHRGKDGFGPALAITLLACGVVLAQKDLGTAALMGASALAVIYVGGMRAWQLGVMALAGLVGIAGAVVMEPYRIKRFMVFLDPFSDPLGAGFHPIQSMLAFAHGGLVGRGLGGSVQKYILPEQTSDFIFPVLAEELGFIGSVLVILLFFSILWCGVSIARKSKDPFARLLVFGSVFTLVAQACMNLAVVTVMMPTKGIALPFISNGGTGWVVTAFALGLVAAVDQDNHMRRVEAGAERAQDPEPEEPGLGAPGVAA